MNYVENVDGSLLREDGIIIPESARTRALVYSRVVGFLRPVEDWNVGKQTEFKDRKIYTVRQIDR